MPATLNALIRYKTINSCLYGGRRRWTIRELIDACSLALADARGRYEQVSERTIRDDLRVMRSDILGFNAPIRQEKGLYYYSDPQYSIFTLAITDPDLAGRILSFLLRLRQEFTHPELESILDLVRKLAMKPEEMKDTRKASVRKPPDIFAAEPVRAETEAECTIFPMESEYAYVPRPERQPAAPKPDFLWGFVFEQLLGE